MAELYGFVYGLQEDGEDDERHEKGKYYVTCVCGLALCIFEYNRMVGFQVIKNVSQQLNSILNITAPGGLITYTIFAGLVAFLLSLLLFLHLQAPRLLFSGIYRIFFRFYSAELCHPETLHII